MYLILSSDILLVWHNWSNYLDTINRYPDAAFYFNLRYGIPYQTAAIIVGKFNLNIVGSRLLNDRVNGDIIYNFYGYPKRVNFATNQHLTIPYIKIGETRITISRDVDTNTVQSVNHVESYLLLVKHEINNDIPPIYSVKMTLEIDLNKDELFDTYLEIQTGSMGHLCNARL